jgi:hypothetical protein
VPAEADDPLGSFDCPRCGRTVEERFYGPCCDCRVELAARWRSAEGGGPSETSRFEPVMHVVPNHVATKD